MRSLREEVGERTDEAELARVGERGVRGEGHAPIPPDRRATRGCGTPRLPIGTASGRVGWRAQKPVNAPDLNPGNNKESTMVVQAYILIQTDVGKAAEVATAIAQVKGVTLAEDVTGPYDVIVRAEARNVDELGKLVVSKVQNLDGITRTLTCPVVHI
ncbi:hypothetical protein NLS1_39490 [Nocardioides sp. LS1]|nr:hypothetical protein NLS1_39490 [Nocardioides sp. LS1]